MPIKAKKVEKDRASAFDRGQFAGTCASATTGKRSYYYEEERRNEVLDAAAAGSSSSSSSRSSSLAWAGASPSLTESPAATHSGIHDEEDEDISDDEEVVRRARAATQALLGGGDGRIRPASAKAKPESVAAASLTNERLEAYLRRRAVSVLTLSADGRSTTPPAATSTRRPNYAAPSPTSGTGMAEAANGGRDGQRIGVRSSSAETKQANTGTPALASGGAKDSASVQGALQMHSSNADFQQLMSLLERDVRREQKTAALTTTSITPTKTDTQSSSEVLAAASAAKQQSQTLPPPRTFAALEDIALEQLFEDWCHQSTSTAADADEADDGAGVFIAADHRAAAFTLAAVAALDLGASSWGRKPTPGYAASATPTFVPYSSAAAAHVVNAPLTWEELMQSEVARRNARGISSSSGGASSGGDLLSHPAAIAYQATQRLRRFLQSVDCIERLVGNRRFMRSVAAYLYEHHKVFLPHYNQSPTFPDGASGGATPGPSSSLVEHLHEEYAVYEEFGRRVSAALLSSLTHYVDGFDEAEFVEALYDTPAAFAEGDVLSDHDPVTGMRGPQNVLSFPAWRLVLAMSNFESFFAWMMDYIYEEYHLADLEEESTGLAVAGARGLRALIRSTYKRPLGALAEEASAPVSGSEDATAAPPIAASASAGVSPLPLTAPASDTARTLLPSTGPSSPDGPRAVLSSSSQHLSESSLWPKGTLAPLPSSTPLNPAPPPAPSTLSSSSSLLAGAHLQFFPSPPASAGGSARVGTSKTAAPVYRKRQSTHPGRNLPPITPTTDSIVRSSNTNDEVKADIRAAGVAGASLGASLPVPLLASDAGSIREGTTQPLASPAPSRATTSSSDLAPPHRVTRTRSSTGKRDPATADGPSTERGSKTLKPKSRTSSNTRPKAGEAPKAKPQKPRLNR
ncbi:hypothetical protein ABL78_1264 [Leptomonas seymouri]|uniref:Uncharacterized protein n=1 Tax=Leptomonas seymouri TaxID=5684 RepID=A0A0N0P865_LEPSE|nr:hypothetical protein ABL78_1264 [Leptomonas seymouri]|eukprot:KPI89599.1 hypothetical protein ABL78_1264 [Leptomonas seymouri]